MLTVEELREEVERGSIDTVVAALPDMQGRLMGKRMHARFFLDDTLEHGLEGCSYLLATDMDNEPQPGYEVANWTQGYGDFVAIPDLATLRKTPWLEGTALVLCDVVWADGTPVAPGPRAVLQAQVERARAAGYEALLLTVDAPFAGKRERDVRTGFEVPAEIRAPAIEAAAGHRSLTPAEVFALVDPSITWKDLEQLCGEFELPILVKGLITGEDAALAVEHGAAGVVVSNHGGRQLDNTPATIDALPEVVEAVAGRIPVLIDGGIRRGTDVAVALALGAEAVLVGRPALWGLAWDGEAGARRALEMLADELRLALALLGAPNPAALTVDHVQRRR